VATEPEASMSSLAGRLGVSLSTLSGVVDRLVEHGFLERREDAADRRQVIIVLTAEGCSVIERFRELGSRHFRSLLELLDNDELAGLARGVGAMVSRAGSVAPVPTPNPSTTPTAAPTAQERNPA
jgi:DNA-binding MarR family transcriptional regulator